MVLLDSMRMLPAGTVRFVSLSFEEAGRLISEALADGTFESAVGNEGTAAVLSKMIGVRIFPSHQDVRLTPWNSGLVAQVMLPRLVEGGIPEAEIQITFVLVMVLGG